MLWISFNFKTLTFIPLIQHEINRRTAEDKRKIRIITEINIHSRWNILLTVQEKHKCFCLYYILITNHSNYPDFYHSFQYASSEISC